jgi:serine/threonine-protein kinase
MIGSILGNRYEILSEIGSGGMARVYMAKDRYLQRVVAIKVLKDEFREDSEFLKRFDKEAQAAASLTHPNIVQIYDVGRDSNRYYIVMEYVDGITLKEYISDRGSLDWREAINISIQVCSALAKAHSRHIIHRDIKPNNIIMTSDGVPKVADFGIARSVSNDTATMKTDTIGSVHYSSPEQVRGGYTDEQSDIYSIGVTIFEMVTGKLPFDGETPVAVALKHIQDEPPVPSSLKPGIPQALDQIILKAMAKSKQERYATMNELINDLENTRSKPVHDIVVPNIRHENDMYNTKKIAALGDEDLRKNSSSLDPESNDENGGNRSRKIMPILYIAIILVILGGIGYFIWAMVSNLLPDPETQPKQITLGNYVARDIEEVKTELEKDGISPVINYEFNEDVDKNVVIRQRPLADTSYKVGGMTPLELWVSKGIEMVKIPSVKMEDHSAMKFKLQDELGLVVEEKPEYNEEVPVNLCIRSEPGETEVKKGSKVILYWSMGPEKKQVVVPNLIDSTYDEAVKKLQSYNLKVGNTYPLGRKGYQGEIVDQVPKAGDTVTEDTAVDIFFKEQDSQTGGDEPAPSGNNKTITVTLPTGGGYNFGNTVRYRAVSIDSATGQEYTMFDYKDVPVTEFPKQLSVPVPSTGGVTIRVYINDLLVNEDTF